MSRHRNRTGYPNSVIKCFSSSISEQFITKTANTAGQGIPDIFDYIKKMEEAGKVRYVGFSSHTPSVAERILDTGVADMMMFSINPAYDLEQGDAYGIGSVAERAKLFRRCEAEGIGISVMKPLWVTVFTATTVSPARQELMWDW